MSTLERPQTINFENGVKDKPTFSAEEMSNRIAKLRAQMAESNTDAAIFSSIHNINYYADFVYCSFGRPYALVVTHDAHTTVSANIDGGQPWRQSFADRTISNKNPGPNENQNKTSGKRVVRAIQCGR